MILAEFVYGADVLELISQLALLAVSRRSQWALMEAPGVRQHQWCLQSSMGG